MKNRQNIYNQCILTIIAICLCWLCFKDLVRPPQVVAQNFSQNPIPVIIQGKFKNGIAVCVVRNTFILEPEIPTCE